MNKSPQILIAEIVKENRIKLGYTQKEVSEISNISLRSIQRIEKGEVMPRLHTIKLLASCLDFKMENVTNSQTFKKKNIIHTTILSISLIVLPMLLFAAFVSQSSTFPETEFELLIGLFILLSTIAFVQLKIWNKKSKSGIL